MTRPDPVCFRAYLGEAALRQRIGSRRIMADHLTHLLELARRQNIEIGVLPFDSGWHPGLEGPVLLIESASGDAVAPPGGARFRSLPAHRTRYRKLPGGDR
ncbi:MAG: Scr1 family TA system antitoxin-like transcriptional regulator [Sciscionella sp.]